MQSPERRILSVIMPAYNEEASIAYAVSEVRRQILDSVPGSELIVIDDGSQDETGTILDELVSHDADIRVIHQTNGGHGAALITGLTNTHADFVFLVDSDLQIPLDDFPVFWEKARAGYDCVFGLRRVRHDAGSRILLTRVVRTALTLLFGIRLFDANVPYKLFRLAVWEEASRYIPKDTLAPSLFLAIFAIKRNYKVMQIDVAHRERQAGEVSIRKLKLLIFCMKAFAQLWTFRSELNHGKTS